MTTPDWKWQLRAACRGEDLVLFFGYEGERLPDRLAREQRATKVCDSCPVRLACRETAFVLKMENGVWGGLGEDERASKRRTWVKNGSFRRRTVDVAAPAPAPALEKHCPACETTKPVADFPKDRRQPDGLNRVCKDCANKAGKESRDRQRATRAVA